MAGPMDDLRVRLSLDGDFSAKAKKARADAKDLADGVKEVEDAQKHLEQETKRLDDALDKQADALRQGVSGFKAYADDALSTAIRLSPTLMGVSGSAASLATSIGKTLGSAMESAIGFISSPAGLLASMALLAGAFQSGVFAVGAFAGALVELGPLIASIGSGVVIGLGALLSLPFIKASAEMDRYKRQFTAIFGSTGAGNQAVDAMRSYGLKSPLSQGPIAQLVRIIGQGGKDVNRYLPVAETLSLAGREDPDTNARDIASIFMRLMGGQVADAFGPEGLGRFGINRKMLEGAGAKFDAGGTFLGDPDDALAVLEKLTQTHPVLKDLRALMEESTDTRLSNAWDAVALAIQDAGDALKGTFLPVIEQAANWIRDFTKSGMLQDLVQRFTGFLQDMITNSMGGLKDVIASGMALVSNLPQIFQSALGVVQKIANVILNLMEAAMTFIGGAGAKAVLHAGIEAGKAAVNAAGSAATGTLDILTIGQFSEDRMRYRHMLDGVGVGGSGGSKRFPGIAGGFPDPEQEMANQHLAAIERNTKELVDTQRLVLGGRELGRLGVSAVSVFGGRGSGTSIGHAVAEVIDDHIDRVLNGFSRAQGLPLGNA